jgi:hypothetical protein
VALVAAGQQALHVNNCPEQGGALLEHARQLALAHGYGLPATPSSRPPEPRGGRHAA